MEYRAKQASGLMKKLWILAGVIVVAAVAGWEFRDRLPFLSSFIHQASADTGENAGGNQQHRRTGGPPPVVKTVAAIRAALPMDIMATGWADADENTTIAAQQAGTILNITADDGAIVKTGDLIAKLDDRAAKATIEKDKAVLVRDQATLAQAETALARASNLLKGNAGTQQSVDEARAARDTAAATVESDKATTSADQVELDNTDIRAPFDGRLGDISVSTGAYLSAGAAVVTIAKYDPIYVKFDLPEAYLEALREGFAAGTIGIDAAPQNSAKAPLKGVLSFFDNTVDSASGTILAKARFDNPSGALWPGQSVNVTVHFQSDRQDIVVPTVAVSPGATGSFVYTVGKDGKVHVTPVTVARSNGSNTALTSGLEAGAHVVIEGQVQLVDGAQVTEEFANRQDSSLLNANGNDGQVEVGAAR